MTLPTPYKTFNGCDERIDHTEAELVKMSTCFSRFLQFCPGRYPHTHTLLRTAVECAHQKLSQSTTPIHRRTDLPCERTAVSGTARAHPVRRWIGISCGATLTQLQRLRAHPPAANLISSVVIVPMFKAAFARSRQSPESRLLFAYFGMHRPIVSRAFLLPTVHLIWAVSDDGLHVCSSQQTDRWVNWSNRPPRTLDLAMWNPRNRFTLLRSPPPH
ncbi:hypothetical protein LIA77_11205 [Sarocladium implicatum]|nr:hypothetical protein LIA77_11205 [Sarocladium implicatum]